MQDVFWRRARGLAALVGWRAERPSLARQRRHRCGEPSPALRCTWTTGLYGASFLASGRGRFHIRYRGGRCARKFVAYKHGREECACLTYQGGMRWLVPSPTLRYAHSTGPDNVSSNTRHLAGMLNADRRRARVLLTHKGLWAKAAFRALQPRCRWGVAGYALRSAFTAWVDSLPLATGCQSAVVYITRCVARVLRTSKGQRAKGSSAADQVVLGRRVSRLTLRSAQAAGLDTYSLDAWHGMSFAYTVRRSARSLIADKSNWTKHTNAAFKLHLRWHVALRTLRCAYAA